MAVLSVLQSAGRNAARYGTITLYKSPNLLSNGMLIGQQAVRQMGGHRVMKIAPSRWSWNTFKDHLNFVLMFYFIPIVSAFTYMGIFIGPAKLVETPEDYVPNHWEYYAHPFPRWLARNFYHGYQQEYESALHHIYEEEYKMKLRMAEKRIRAVMAANQDSQTHYFVPASARYQKVARQGAEEGFVLKGSD